MKNEAYFEREKYKLEIEINNLSKKFQILTGYFLCIPEDVLLSFQRKSKNFKFDSFENLQQRIIYKTYLKNYCKKALGLLKV